MTHEPIGGHQDSVGRAIQKNIETIARLEREFAGRRTLKERIADVISGFSGSLTFVIVHVVWFTLWILGNQGAVPGFPRFDRYPFELLTLIVSLEAIFLSTFVLIKQDRMSRRADQRAQLDLQIDLLAEREMTLVLQMLQRLSTRLGVRLSGQEIQELSEETSVEALASRLQEQMPK